MKHTPPPTETDATASQTANARELILNLVLNILLPSVVLTQLSDDGHLGVTRALLVAIAFPLFYGGYDFYRQRKLNLFSALGLINITLTGGIGLLGLEARYIAIKEATVPAIFGLATLASLKTRYPVINTLVFNNAILDVAKIQRVLAEKQLTDRFSKVMKRANYIVAGSFFLSSTLNYILATVVVTSRPGSAAFNHELGRMTALSYPVIAIPSLLVMMIALGYLFRNIHRLTGLTYPEILHEAPSGRPSS